MNDTSTPLPCDGSPGSDTSCQAQDEPDLPTKWVIEDPEVVLMIIDRDVATGSIEEVSWAIIHSDDPRYDELIETLEIKTAEGMTVN